MDGCSGSPDEMNDTRAHSRWHDRTSYDDRRHSRDSVWHQDIWTLSMGIKMTRWDATLHWETLARAEPRSSRMIWPIVEANRMCRRRFNMHAHAACVVEQAWIPHKRCSMGEDKPHLRSDEATKPRQKTYMGLNFLSRLVVSVSRSQHRTTKNVGPWHWAGFLPFKDCQYLDGVATWLPPKIYNNFWENDYVCVSVAWNLRERDC